MIALDTNILVRYLIKDDPDQAVLATNFLANNRCFLHKSVLLELVWVLASPAGYKLSRETVHERLLHVLGLSCIESEDPTIVSQALTWYAEGMDFGDALHLASSSELAGLATFDKKFASTAEKLDAKPPITLIS
ncbi:toxin, PIN family [Citrifermentans bemidjiense Bem]|uniref:Toxin, PIN family n=1 Tax=Citrifermentans bemidjiense (strain ATCC BAA-1014 / DSM 16622 / JCM 12645 / Bem) TaxID=404380 RepID=B5EB70_CITBB|nr:type II toxin-antitoxin system VapC family toxin [Citrifermentans bemidjiense]ACH38931.1 toxin, PIN family [Citrifermentans bemidjiense Bem]